MEKPVLEKPEPTVPRNQGTDYEYYSSKFELELPENLPASFNIKKGNEFQYFLRYSLTATVYYVLVADTRKTHYCKISKYIRLISIHNRLRSIQSNDTKDSVEQISFPKVSIEYNVAKSKYGFSYEPLIHDY